MIEVRIYRTEVEEAARFAKKLQALKEGLASTIISRPDFQVIGELGVLAVKKYFKAIKLPFDEPNEGNARHTGDSCDLLVAGKKVDVKTSRKYQLITVNNKQYYKTKIKGIDYLIGVYFPDKLDLAQIIGYGLWYDLVRDKDKDFIYQGKSVPMYSLPQEKLHLFKINDIKVNF
jgi:hypothetical protein